MQEIIIVFFEIADAALFNDAGIPDVTATTVIDGKLCWWLPNGLCAFGPEQSKDALRGFRSDRCTSVRISHDCNFTWRR